MYIVHLNSVVVPQFNTAVQIKTEIKFSLDLSISLHKGQTLRDINYDLNDPSESELFIRRPTLDCSFAFVCHHVWPGGSVRNNGNCVKSTLKAFCSK